MRESKSIIGARGLLGRSPARVAVAAKAGAFLLATGMLIAGCASAPQGSSEAGTYRESASDVSNRAPRSMSLPAQGPSLPLDEASMREQADLHFSLAEAFALDGNVPRAVEEYKLALVYDQKAPIIRLRLAAQFVKQGLVSEAMEQAKLAIAADPRSAEAYLLLGGLQSALRAYDDALASYRKAESLDPGSSEATMFMGALLAEQKKYAESIQVFEALTKRAKPESAHLAWYYLGRVRLEQDAEANKAIAERDLRRALKAKPSFVDAALALGALYEATSRRKDAVKLYRDFQAKQGPDASIAECLARLYLESDEYDLALGQLEVMESADPDNLGARMKIAFIMIKQARYAEAIVRLEDILAKAPDSDKIAFYLGAVYEEIKDYKRAIGYFAKLSPSSPYYAEGVVHSSYLYKMLGDYAKAIEAIEGGLKTKDDYPQFYSLYASLLDDEKQYSRALDVLARGTRRFPDHAQLRFFMGSMQGRNGDFEGMVASMRRVLELDGNHVQALNYLAYSLAEHNAKLDEAELLVRKALSLQPRDGYVMDTLGWVLFKRGNFGEAVRVLEAAFKLVPNEAIIAEHLGDAYYKNQLPDKAKKMYQKAADVDASPENLKKIRSKLGSVDYQASPPAPSAPSGHERAGDREPSSEAGVPGAASAQ